MTFQKKKNRNSFKMTPNTETISALLRLILRTPSSLMGETISKLMVPQWGQK